MKPLVWLVAWRYIWGKKSQQAVNYMAAIAVAGLSTGTMAMIILLSAFNGLEEWAVNLYNAFDSDYVIKPTTGGRFSAKAPWIEQINNLAGVESHSLVFECNGLVTHRDRQTVAKLKGVSPGYETFTGLDSMIYEGQLQLEQVGRPSAVLGIGVAMQLNLNLNDFDRRIQVYLPRKNAGASDQLASAFHNELILCSGIFQVQPEYDNAYVLVPIQFLWQLTEDSLQISSIEVHTINRKQSKRIADALSQLAGSTYEVQSRFEQHALLYKIIRSEKWMIFLILGLIILIASFTLIGAIAMIMVEKQRDSITLHTLGMQKAALKQMFLLLGIFLTLLSAVLGLLLGWLVCLGQIRFSFVMINFRDAYPILLKPLDFGLVFATVLLIGSLASIWPSRRLHLAKNS